MFKTFIQSFQLRNTYKVNTIIYSIKQLPFIKKILPDALYQSRALKILGTIISILIEIGSIFIGKVLYIAIMIFSVLSLYEGSQSDTFVHIFFFLTIIGAILNTYIFNPTRDKYYAMFIMRMNAKEYTITNYLYSLLKLVVGFLPFTILSGRMAGVHLWICLLLPFFVVSSKIIVGATRLYLYEKKKNIDYLNESKPGKYLWISVFFLLALAYGLPFIGITINVMFFLGIVVITILGVMIAWPYLMKCNQYREIYKQLLATGTVQMNVDTKKIAKDNVLKQIDITMTITSDKTGYAYFNDLFVKRHSKILMNSIKKISTALLILFVVLVIAIYFSPEFKAQVNKMLMTMLPWFVFIMYFLNRGQGTASAMFMNCDHSMLTYGFYRKPTSILGLFRQRAKSVIGINLIPAVILGIGLTILLYVSGGTSNNYDYLILFISILSMSVFFSIHNLVLYYLLQPYNVYSETKSATYSLANMITYFVCYAFIKVEMPTTYFGIAMIVFAIIYGVISLGLVYRLAPKTFRLRV